MTKGFYRRLAWTGIRKNKRLYKPYILTCIGMIMIFYIMRFLCSESILQNMPGRVILESILELGSFVIAVFAAIFLFYTNSFLTRGRKKEFGLYNILGMGKRNLAKVLVWENLMVSVFSLGIGLLLGIIFSKLVELGLINLMEGTVNFSLEIDLPSIWYTIELFAVIFLIIFLNALRQIQLSKPIELLHSEHTGEKPPKANWLLALVGAGMLGAAYYMAVSIKDPVSALMWFFVAVIMVIIATYLLFVAGSVALCKLLQKKKGYYYKSNHFVALSSMIYRMKRNGAGLASICILCTMVLVMISSSMCLYMGKEDSLNSRYLRGINVSAYLPDLQMIQAAELDEAREVLARTAQKEGQSMENVVEYTRGELAAYIRDGKAMLNDAALYEFQIDTYTDVWKLCIVSLADYNKIMNQNETLQQGEVLMYTDRGEYLEDSIDLGAGAPLKIKKRVPEFLENGYGYEEILPSMYLFVPDLAETLTPLMSLADAAGDQMISLKWYYGFDVQDEKAQLRMEDHLIEEGLEQISDRLYLTLENKASEKEEFYGLYGGLFFLGILLGTVFICAAVLIIYYKQISEGYEDQARFEIMQKVGMTKKEIRKSINSQVLTVFFLPLVTAGVHLAFAFPLIYKMLMLFGLLNREFLIGVTIGCFCVFALFYVLVYQLTSRAYFSIVSEVKE